MARLTLVYGFHHTGIPGRNGPTDAGTFQLGICAGISAAVSLLTGRKVPD